MFFGMEACPSEDWFENNNNVIRYQLPWGARRNYKHSLQKLLHEVYCLKKVRALQNILEDHNKSTVEDKYPIIPKTHTAFMMECFHNYP